MKKTAVLVLIVSIVFHVFSAPAVLAMDLSQFLIEGTDGLVGGPLNDDSSYDTSNTPEIITLPSIDFVGGPLDDNSSVNLISDDTSSNNDIFADDSLIEIISVSDDSFDGGLFLDDSSLIDLLQPSDDDTINPDPGQTPTPAEPYVPKTLVVNPGEEVKIDEDIYAKITVNNGKLEMTGDLSGTINSDSGASIVIHGDSHSHITAENGSEIQIEGKKKMSIVYISRRPVSMIKQYHHFMASGSQL